MWVIIVFSFISPDRPTTERPKRETTQKEYFCVGIFQWRFFVAKEINLRLLEEVAMAHSHSVSMRSIGLDGLMKVWTWKGRVRGWFSLSRPFSDLLYYIPCTWWWWCWWWFEGKLNLSLVPPPFQDQYRAVRSCFNTLFAVKRDSGFTKQAFALHCTPGKDGMKEENIFFLTSFEPFLSSSKLRYFPLSLTHKLLTAQHCENGRDFIRNRRFCNAFYRVLPRRHRTHPRLLCSIFEPPGLEIAELNILQFGNKSLKCP